MSGLSPSGLTWINLIIIVSAILSDYLVVFGEEESVKIRHNNFHCYGNKPHLENGHYELLGKAGHVIRAHCDTGFQLVGPKLRMCDVQRKRFTEDEPKCHDIDECLVIGSQTVNDEGSTMGSIATDDTDDSPVACHHLATCINTPGSYNCQCPDQYVGNGFTCSEPSVCPVFEPPEHGYVQQVSTGVIRIFCHPDYSIHGQNVIRCHHGNWSAKTPRCIQGWQTCGDPGIPLNGFRRGSRFNVGSVLRFYCRTGFTLMGPRLRICEEGSQQWTSYQPICKNGHINDISNQKPLSTASPESNDNSNPQILTEQPEWLAKISMTMNIRSTVAPSCGGAVICDGGWVITSSTCLQKALPKDDVIELLEPSDIVVLISGKAHRVSRVLRYPGFLSSTVDSHGNHIGLIKLQNQTSNLQSVCLKERNGTVRHVNLPGNSGKMQVSACKDSQNTSHNFCIEDKRISQLPGTPVVTKTMENTDCIVGILSEREAGIYINVTSYMPWISKVTNYCESNISTDLKKSL